MSTGMFLFLGDKIPCLDVPSSRDKAARHKHVFVSKNKEKGKKKGGKTHGEVGSKQEFPRILPFSSFFFFGGSSCKGGWYLHSMA